MSGLLRRGVLGILLLGLLGTAAELVLLDHDEDVRQLIPLALIGVALVLLAWLRLQPRPAGLRAFQITMALFILSGFVGVVLHYQGNMEFQREADPSIDGFDLFWKVMRAKAPPALAPGAMVQLGLLGLVYTFRHPMLEGGSDNVRTNGG